MVLTCFIFYAYVYVEQQQQQNKNTSFLLIVSHCGIDCKTIKEKKTFLRQKQRRETLTSVRNNKIKKL
jgi:hypothetical protein